MNFFEYQEAARRQTRWLIFYYVLAVILIILTLFAVATCSLHYSDAAGDNTPFNWALLWDPTLLSVVTLATSILILTGSLYKISVLSAGGEAVARMLDGRPVNPNTSCLEEKRLLNVVEEMAIASGTPVPRVFVLDDEAGINAFAAGYSPKDCVIGVTRGALDQLNREELQGVIGHEFSHILNGDMRLNIRLIGVLNGILVIALTGYWIFRVFLQSDSGSRSRDKKGNGLMAVALFGVAMMVIGYIGVFFARLIKSAVSRQREFLADASSVQFTRNPTGLAHALAKIGGLRSGSRLRAHSAEAASHLFFANGVGATFLDLLSTHPPLKERIRRLDPLFTTTSGQATPERPPPLPVPDEMSAGLATAAPLAADPVLTPRQAVSLAGTLHAATLGRITDRIQALPTDLLEAAHQSGPAQALLLGLLLHEDAAVQAKQKAILDQHNLTDLAPDLAALSVSLTALPAGERRTLAGLATATLKDLEPSRYTVFRAALVAFVEADAEISLFEYMIMHMLIRNLDPHFGLRRRPRPRFKALAQVSREAETVMSALSWFGASTADAAAASFEAGRKELGSTTVTLLPAAEASLAAMDKALDLLAQTTPPVKQLLIAGFTATVMADGTVTTNEAEALRAVADALDCPLPPMV